MYKAITHYLIYILIEVLKTSILLYLNIVLIINYQETKVVYYHIVLTKIVKNFTQLKFIIP